MMVIIRDLFLGKRTFSEFLMSPESISNTVLTNRLQRLRSMGMIRFVRDPGDRKVKNYYMTDVAVDLYPVLYELMHWTRRHTKVTFLPVAEEFFKKTEGQAPQDIITEVQNTYRLARESLLSSMQS